MIELENFYDLVNKNAQVTLAGSRTGKIYYKGSVKNIPDEYDDSIVENFSMNDNGHLTFKIRIKASRAASNGWIEGVLRVESGSYHYWMKIYDAGSQYGIDGGRVSKLMLKRRGEIVCNYDRGWDTEPVDEETELAKEILLAQYNG